jgi:hypothetical protein
MSRTARISFLVGMGLLLLGQQAVWAASGTTLDAAATTLNNLFILSAFFLGGAGTAGLVYSIAQRTYGLVFDGSIALLVGCAMVASWTTLGGLVGVSAAATLPIPPLP